MTGALVIASIAVALAAAVYLALRTDIEPDAEPMEFEEPADDRWGDHKAVEDR